MQKILFIRNQIYKEKAYWRYFSNKEIKIVVCLMPLKSNINRVCWLHRESNQICGGKLHLVEESTVIFVTNLNLDGTASGAKWFKRLRLRSSFEPREKHLGWLVRRMGWVHISFTCLYIFLSVYKFRNVPLGVKGFQHG